MVSKLPREQLEKDLEEMISHRYWRWTSDIETKVISLDVESVGCTVVSVVYDFEESVLGNVKSYYTLFVKITRCGIRSTRKRFPHQPFYCYLYRF